jgi:hypothetical protein
MFQVRDNFYLDILMQAITILENAKSIIKYESSWIRFTNAADGSEQTSPVEAESLSAVRWSARGALERVRFEHNLDQDDWQFEKALNLVLKQMIKINDFNFTTWRAIDDHNDALTHEQVIFAFDRAIQSLDKKNS